MDSLVSKLKANEAARRNVPIDDLLSIEYAAGYSAALNQMERDLSIMKHDLMKDPVANAREISLVEAIIGEAITIHFPKPCHTSPSS